MEKKEFLFSGKHKRAALVACSNGIALGKMAEIEAVKEALSKMGIHPLESAFLYCKNGVASGTAKQRAEALMEYYRDESVDAVFDVSGGDIANEVLPYLEYEEIAHSQAVFFGYSDLTTILNAIYQKTGRPSVLYQIRNLVYQNGNEQKKRFAETFLEKKKTLFDISYHFLQGHEMQGVVVGGNIRCLLKLAGTPYFPDMNGKILLLESLGGEVPQMTAFLNQLKQMGVFDQIRGILLGTFTRLEQMAPPDTMYMLVKRYAGKEIPVAKTYEIGHGTDAKAIWIGKKMTFQEQMGKEQMSKSRCQRVDDKE